jgi:DNA-binding winged helix-turn-helix (wHTH) protein/Flp pilus assembly protein TadD
VTEVPPSSGVVRFAAFEVDLANAEVRKHGFRIRLQDQPFRVLQILLEHPGELVTREELQRQIWPADTFVDFEKGLNNAVKRLRDALGDSAGQPRIIETHARRGYRFVAHIERLHGPNGDSARVNPEVPPKLEEVINKALEKDKKSRYQSAVDMRADLHRLKRDTESARLPVATSATVGLNEQQRIRWKVIVPAATAVVALAIGSYSIFHRTSKLTAQDTIVLADFTNTTGDAIFDSTLRQGLSVQLQQSPFLSLVSDRRIQQTLRLMEQPTEAKLTPEISREICQRTGSTAVIEGSIAQIGTQYSLILKAVNCANGELFTSTEAQASDKSHVLDALGKSAAELRNKLGESLTTVQKFDTPLAQATTPSLEALEAFSLGAKTMGGDDSAAAVPFFQRAIKLDPKFALAYAYLGACYSNLGETSLAAENNRRAYELRDRASEREKLLIDSNYYASVTGDLEKDRRDLEVWAQTYPRDRNPHNGLGVDWETVGQYDKSLAEYREALRLSRNLAMDYDNLVDIYRLLDRFEEARATLEEARTKGIDSPVLHAHRYILAFLGDDAAGMKQQVDWGAGKPGLEDLFLAYEANTAAYFGLLANAREFSRRAAASAERAEEKEVAASYEKDAALREALFGNIAQARHRIDSALRLSIGRNVQYGVALALALIGDAARAQGLADDLGKRFPQDTVVQFNYLPTLHAQVELIRNDPLKAIEVLQAATPYEFGHVHSFSFYPVYVRGEAYRAAGQGSEAAAEFHKILDHHSIVVNEPIGALAHLQVGRAYAMQGDTAKAKAAYQDFLTLWKDADADIPILIAAKAEYSKLQ